MTITLVNIGLKQTSLGSYSDMNPADCKLPSPLVATELVEWKVNPLKTARFFIHTAAAPVYSHAVEEVPGEFWSHTGKPKMRVRSTNNLTGESKFFSEEKWS